MFSVLYFICNNIVNLYKDVNSTTVKQLIKCIIMQKKKKKKKTCSLHERPMTGRSTCYLFSPKR